MDNTAAKRLPFLPIACEVEAGKTYYWCSCGKSDTQPFCNWQHNCENKALAYKALLSETVSFCGCKQTQDPPFCDGSHASLLLDYLKKMKADSNQGDHHAKDNADS